MFYKDEPYETIKSEYIMHPVRCDRCGEKDKIVKYAPDSALKRAIADWERQHAGRCQANLLAILVEIRDLLKDQRHSI